MNVYRDDLNTAIEYHRSGDWMEAEKIYRRVIQSDPRNANAHYLMGVLASQLGSDTAAVEWLKKAIGLEPMLTIAYRDLGILFKKLLQPASVVSTFEQAVSALPNNAELHNCLGNAYRDVGNQAAAETAYRKSLLLNPNLAESQSNLGLVLHEQGQFEAALDAYQMALQLRPDLAQIHINQGNAFKVLQRLDEAIASYRSALRMVPSAADVWNSLGVALYESSRFDEAFEAYSQTTVLSPNHPMVDYNRGLALLGVGRLDEAVQAFRRTIEIDPSRADAYNNLGTAFEKLGEWEPAVDAFHRALELRPDFARASYNLGLVQTARGELDAAVASYRKALELQSEFPEAYFNLGCVLQELGQYELALPVCREALRLNCDFSAASLTHLLQQMCDWNELPSLSKRVVLQVAENENATSPYPTEPLSFLALPIETSAENQWKCATQWALNKKYDSLERVTSLRPTEATNRRIRLGYLSADFKNHPVGYLVADLIESHDREHFEVYGYSLGTDDQSSLSRRFRAAFERFEELHRCSHRQAAQKIADDKIDILIDLQGYTLHSRPQILGHRPAPIQVNYLGYPGTLGATSIDYILVDEFIVPRDQQNFYTEQLLHLPGCYMVNDRYREIAAGVPDRRELGLPRDAFVFCTFSSSYKITPALFEVWLSLLRRIPTSVLWLKEHRFSRANLVRYAEEAGIEADRLIFAPTIPMPEHLARHRAADLFLDTFPYNQHSTASDALRMGLPVITCVGQTFVSRVAGSLLNALGLPELITDSLDDYEALAYRLANNRDELARIRRKLDERLQSTMLFDGQAFARQVEPIYQRIFDTAR